jgi:hypothetical protein
VIALIALAVVLLAVLPLILFAELIDQQASKGTIVPGWYLCIPISWLGGVAVAFVCLVGAAGYISRSHEFSEWLVYPLLVVSGPVGGSVGPGLIYLHLRLRRTHDPDYEDAPKPQEPAGPSQP